ncbi:hypothetical protein NSS94_04305 [Paenibacillus sp. FSL L8-0644]|uniref:hypothetical protein n=1 Tax=Paenibacillus sp. FSL L8-0644 TaxID=2954523 RepID=UPI0030FBF5A4
MDAELEDFVEVNNYSNVLESYFQSEKINRIHIFALGPEGTNIYEAAKLWTEEKKISHKSEFILCETPKEAILKAKKIQEPNSFPVFVLCAVYNRLSELYFSNSDCYFFMDHLYMKLDEMQLATKELTQKESYTVSSHASPSTLLNKVPNVTIVNSNSNAYAAISCRNQEVDLCITTEKARKANDLISVHKFGSPWMLFTFGTTSHGIDLLQSF